MHRLFPLVALAAVIAPACTTTPTANSATPSSTVPNHVGQTDRDVNPSASRVDSQRDQYLAMIREREGLPHPGGQSAGHSPSEGGGHSGAHSGGASGGEQVIARRAVDLNRPDVIWADPNTATQTHPVTPPAADSARPNPLADYQPDPQPEPEPAEEVPAFVVESTTPATTTDALDAALASIRRSDDPTLQQALYAAMLSLATPTRELDWRFVEPLAPMDRETVVAFHQFLIEVNDRIVAEGGQFDPAALLLELDGHLGRSPAVEIASLALCRSVSGFGIYEELNQQAFLAGQDNPMVLYLELDNFATEPQDTGEYEVRVTQSITLYHETDDLVVWQQNPVAWTDRSRNRRRDFFLAQPVTLPSRIGVGRYRMKVTIIDHHSDTMYEQTLPIDIVADSSLANGGGGASDDVRWGRD